MKKNILKHVFSLIAIIFLFAPVFAFLPAQALDETDLGVEYAAGIGLGEKDPRDIAAGVIQVLMGFLGIIAVVIILVGGFKWMIAGGNSDKVEEAKKLIYSGVIGLVIILASWGIANFVLTSLMSATSA